MEANTVPAAQDVVNPEINPDEEACRDSIVALYVQNQLEDAAQAHLTPIRQKRQRMEKELIHKLKAKELFAGQFPRDGARYNFQVRPRPIFPSQGDILDNLVEKGVPTEFHEAILWSVKNSRRTSDEMIVDRNPL